jgi:hypothetical protein
MRLFSLNFANVFNWIQNCNYFIPSGSMNNIKFYTRILLLGISMCEIYCGLNCAGNISTSFPCHLVCRWFGGHEQCARNKLHIYVPFFGLRFFFIPRKIPHSMYPCRHIVLCAQNLNYKILLQYFWISERRNCTKGMPTYNYVGARKFFVIIHSCICFPIYCEK